MNEVSNAPSVSTHLPGRLRRWLMLLVALLGLIVGAILTIGRIPFTPDIPPAGLTNGAPGSGGLRRAFPDMKLRANNPTTPERVELGRLLYFDPVLSGDNSFEQPGAKSFPRVLPSNVWPNVARRAYTRGFAWLRDPPLRKG